MILSRSKVKTHLSNAGFTGVDLNKAVLIAECESSFNTFAHNINFEDSRGLMQINLDAHPEYFSIDLFNPVINTEIAFILYQNAGNTFRDWTCANTLGLLKNEVPIYFALGIMIGIVLYLTS